jgi:hypothetical protein
VCNPKCTPSPLAAAVRPAVVAGPALAAADDATFSVSTNFFPFCFGVLLLPVMFGESGFSKSIFEEVSISFSKKDETRLRWWGLAFVMKSEGIEKQQAMAVTSMNDKNHKNTS